MTEFFDYTRYDVVAPVTDVREEEAPCGRYVLAVDAICREAVLQGRIRQLERQLAAKGAH